MSFIPLSSSILFRHIKLGDSSNSRLKVHGSARYSGTYFCFFNRASFFRAFYELTCIFSLIRFYKLSTNSFKNPVGGACHDELCTLSGNLVHGTDNLVIGFYIQLNRYRLHRFFIVITHDLNALKVTE